MIGLSVGIVSPAHPVELKILWISSYFATIDWDATGSMLQGLGTLGGVIAVYAAARFGFSTWRRQKLAERDRDQAEVILQAAYNSRRALRHIRSPLMTGHEQATSEEKLAKDQPNWREQVPEQKQERLITAQAYYSRIHSFRDEQAKLEDCLPMARALFGEELEQAIEKLHRQFYIVQTFADAYIDDYNGNDRVFTVKIRRALFASGDLREGEGNEVSDAVAQAIDTIERTCLPILRLETA